MHCLHKRIPGAGRRCRCDGDHFPADLLGILVQALAGRKPFPSIAIPHARRATRRTGILKCERSPPLIMPLALSIDSPCRSHGYRGSVT